MKKTKLILWQSLVGLAPVLYLILIWNRLPESVPIHYNVDLEADKFGSKFELLAILLFMLFISIGTSLLIINLNKFDPKQRYANSNSLMVKISWVIIIFLTLIGAFIVYETEHYAQQNNTGVSPKYMVALLCLLFVVLGNFMNNVKPNYFVGIRTPWSLEDEENWRKTHHVGSRIWFFGGILMLLLVMISPEKYIHYILICSIFPMVVIPIWYSYHLFKQKQKNG